MFIRTATRFVDGLWGGFEYYLEYEYYVMADDPDIYSAWWYAHAD